MTFEVSLIVATLIAALVGTGLLRRYALSRNVLDVPNDRSSHSVPTPRGGGVAVVIAFIGAMLALWVRHRIDSSLTGAVLGGGSIVALVGFVDDHRHIAARWRLLAHFGAAAWVLASLGGLPVVQAGGSSIDVGVLGNVVAAVALVWLLNLYNFMDGIDGIAGIEAITVCVAAIALYAARGLSPSAILPPALLASATLGFLIWNFPPARIFMGDAGSGFLGIMLGVLALRSASLSPALLWSWIVLLGCFVVDATVTLIRRLGRRERVYQAHRSHAYQHATQRVGRHKPVTLAVGVINIVWLLPIALLVAIGRIDGLLGVVIAYAPLVWIAIVLRAGQPTRS